MTANTTNGLPYMVGTDAMADVDTIMQSLAQKIDDLVLAGWTAYTPTWLGAATNPTIGNATRAGFYRWRGRTVDGRFIITVGSTTNIGAGVYSFGLPVPPKAGYDDIPIGSGLVRRGAVRSGRIAAADSTVSNTLRLYDAGAGGSMQASSFALVAGDIIAVQFTYESANAAP